MSGSIGNFCFICAGADDDPGFDECAVCGRKGVPLPYGGPAPTYGAAMHRPATGLDPARRPGESDLARGIRLARGIPDPEDVPGILRAIDGVALDETGHTKGRACPKCNGLCIFPMPSVGRAS